MKKQKLPNYRSEGENYDKFKFAFNIEQKFIIGQNQLKEIQVQHYEQSKYMPADIHIQSQFVHQMIDYSKRNQEGKLHTKQKLVRTKQKQIDLRPLSPKKWDLNCVKIRSLSPTKQLVDQYQQQNPFYEQQDTKAEKVKRAQNQLKSYSNLCYSNRPASRCAVPKLQQSLFVHYL